MTADFVILSELCERKIHYEFRFSNPLSIFYGYFAALSMTRNVRHCEPFFLKNGAAIYVDLGVIVRICKA